MAPSHELLWDPDGDTVSVRNDMPLEVLLYREGPEPLAYSHPSSLCEAVDDGSDYRVLASLPSGDDYTEHEMSLEEFESMVKEPLPLYQRNPAPRFQYQIELGDTEDKLLPAYRRSVRDDEPRYLY